MSSRNSTAGSRREARPSRDDSKRPAVARKAGGEAPLRPGRVFETEGEALARGRVSGVQRARMLIAARQVVAREGYARMSVERVVARAGVSRKTFYDLFENREECFLEAYDDAIVRGARIVVEAYTVEQGWRERMRAGLAAILGMLDDEPELRTVCVVEALGAGPLVLEHRARVLGVLIAAVDEGRKESRGDPPPLTAEGVVGAVLAVIHARALREARAARSGLERQRSPQKGVRPGQHPSVPAEPLSDLLGALMGMIVLPYLGAAAAAKELERPVPARPPRTSPRAGDALEGLDMRLTYRTLRVLGTIAEHPGASNREVADGGGVLDQGQVSKLLNRLASLGLIENGGAGHLKGTPNAWRLTPRGEEVENAVRTTSPAAQAEPAAPAGGRRRGTQR
jgi:AcrR family transcriptional regulator/DNA-binding MarR family transcriptional regulator